MSFLNRSITNSEESRHEFTFPDPNLVIKIPGREPLTSTMLAAAPLQEQKQMLGERLFPLIQRMYPDLAGKITALLLEIDNAELLYLMEELSQDELGISEEAQHMKEHIEYEYKMPDTDGNREMDESFVREDQHKINKVSGVAAPVNSNRQAARDLEYDYIHLDLGGFLQRGRRAAPAVSVESPQCHPLPYTIRGPTLVILSGGLGLTVVALHLLFPNLHLGSLPLLYVLIPGVLGINLWASEDTAPSGAATLLVSQAAALTAFWKFLFTSDSYNVEARPDDGDHHLSLIHPDVFA